MTFPLITQFASAIPGDSFDGWQNYWNLWWVKVALIDKVTSPWFTDLLYYPTGVSLLFHTLNPFNGVAFLPVQLAFGLLPAYNTVVMFSFVIGGLGAYLLARYVLGPGSSRLPAFVAGAIFTFAPYHIAHLLGHMQLIALEWLPFFALYLLRAVRASARSAGHKMWREVALAVLFLVLVALCDWYYVFYCLILTAVVAAWCIVRGLRDPARGALRRGLLAVIAIWLATAVILSPLLVPMVREAQATNYMVPDREQSRTLSADLLAFVTPQGFHPLWGEWARKASSGFTSSIAEYTVFAGYTVIFLAIVALISRGRRPGKGLWFAIAVTFFVLALGPVLHVNGRTALLPGGAELPLPYGLLNRLPFLNIMRSISRLDVILMLALSILAALGLEALMRKPRRRWIPAVALALVLFEFFPAPYPMSPPDTPAWYETLASDTRPGAVLNLPVNWDRPWYLLYQSVHHKPLTAAYISREDPRTLVDRSPVLRYFRQLGQDGGNFDLGRDGQKALAELGIRWVVLDRYKMPGGPERDVTEAGARQIFGDQPPVYQDERITVYEVSEPAAN